MLNIPTWADFGNSLNVKGNFGLHNIDCEHDLSAGLQTSKWDSLSRAEARKMAEHMAKWKNSEARSNQRRLFRNIMNIVFVLLKQLAVLTVSSVLLAVQMLLPFSLEPNGVWWLMRIEVWAARRGGEDGGSHKHMLPWGKESHIVTYCDLWLLGDDVFLLCDDQILNRCPLWFAPLNFLLSLQILHVCSQNQQHFKSFTSGPNQYGIFGADANTILGSKKTLTYDILVNILHTVLYIKSTECGYQILGTKICYWGRLSYILRKFYSNTGALNCKYFT